MGARLSQNMLVDTRLGEMWLTESGQLKLLEIWGICGEE